MRSYSLSSGRLYLMLAMEVTELLPRPISWLPRLSEIRRSIKNSVRSHYERKDIERLFQLQPRAAQALIQGIAPSARVGRSFLLSFQSRRL
jgi:hypothetical protein